MDGRPIDQGITISGNLRAVLTTLLLSLIVIVAGCAQTGNFIDCAPPTIQAKPERAASAETFRLRGGPFGSGDCGDPGKPLRNIPIDFRQGGKTWHLATVDAGSDYTFDVKVRVPADAKPGAAVVTATSSVGEKKQRFRILEGGGSTAP